MFRALTPPVPRYISDARRSIRSIEINTLWSAVGQVDDKSVLSAQMIRLQVAYRVKLQANSLVRPSWVKRNRFDDVGHEVVAQNQVPSGLRSSAVSLCRTPNH